MEFYFLNIHTYMGTLTIDNMPISYTNPTPPERKNEKEQREEAKVVIARYKTGMELRSALEKKKELPEQHPDQQELSVEC